MSRLYSQDINPKETVPHVHSNVHQHEEAFTRFLSLFSHPQGADLVVCLLPGDHQVVFASPGVTCNYTTEGEEEQKASISEGFVVLGVTGSC